MLKPEMKRRDATDDNVQTPWLEGGFEAAERYARLSSKDVDDYYKEQYG